MIRSRFPLVAATGVALAVSSLGDAAAGEAPEKPEPVSTLVRSSVERVDLLEATHAAMQSRQDVLALRAASLQSTGLMAGDSPADQVHLVLAEPARAVPATIGPAAEPATTGSLLAQVRPGEPSWPALKSRVLALVAEAEADGSEGLEELHALGRALAEREDAVVAALEELEASVADLAAEVDKIEQEVAVKKARSAFAEHLATATHEGRYAAAAKSFRERGAFVPEQMACPVDGPHEFIDSWGFRRSGGRRHKGVDMMAPTGTPLAAPVSGDVVHRTTGLGGLSYFLYGDDGHTYYGTHLSRYGKSGRVESGDIIGFVGSSGNARGIPHLHFEIWPNGGKAVNPYPATKSACG